MSSKYIKIRGARVHNLQNVSVDVPRDKLVVFTGLSGSGKSSLAFDTLYAEGHRRFVESLSSYARQFLGQLDKPDVDMIEGLSPAISIDQKTTSKNPRSTVGTVTEIYDYLRLLYARVGIPHCPVCGKEIRRQTVDGILGGIMELDEGERFMVLAPVVRAKKGTHAKVFADARKSGYTRVRVDGSLYDLEEELNLDKNLRHDVDVVVDRLVMRGDVRSRLADSVETALALADGHLLIVTVPRDGEEEKTLSFSQAYACEEHGISFGELEPRMFSFNNPAGACPACAGLGNTRRVTADAVIPDKTLTLREGAIAVNGFKSLDEDSWKGPLFAAVGEKYGFTVDTRICDMTPRQYEILMYGTGDELYDVTRYFAHQGRRQLVKFEGVIGKIEQLMHFSGMEEYYEAFIEEIPCSVCHGRRLNEKSLAVTVAGLPIDRFCDQSVSAALALVKSDSLKLTPVETEIVREVLKEIRAR
ncbi:MAG: excinuclease ABC subunit UvrA, partial [Clostridia bacterium]|nr:excinuclease ABC subunit UvrA [Clostridia bacterium]